MDFFRKYLIFDISESDKVNYLTTCEGSLEMARKSIDGNKVLISWWSTNEPTYIAPPANPLAGNLEVSESITDQEGTPPPDPKFIESMTSAEGPFLIEDILNILSSAEWHVDITK